jgi:hypothetical protein
MSKYFSEFDFIVSNVFVEKAIEFRKENGCLSYLFDAAMEGKISSAFKKVVIKVYPVNALHGGVKFMPDVTSSVFVVECECDIGVYLKINSKNERYAQLFNFIKDIISAIPDDMGVNKKEILILANTIIDTNYCIYKEHGRWVRSTEKTHSVKIFAEYTMSEIVLGVLVKTGGGESSRHYLVKYDAFNSFHMDKIGSLEFVGKGIIKYTPGVMYISNYIHEPIEFNIIDTLQSKNLSQSDSII